MISSKGKEPTHKLQYTTDVHPTLRKDSKSSQRFESTINSHAFLSLIQTAMLQSQRLATAGRGLKWDLVSMLNCMPLLISYPYPYKH